MTDWTKSSVDLEWIPPLIDGGSKVTGYIVEFKEINKEEEEKRAQKRLLLSDAEEEKEPEGDEGWKKVEKQICKLKAEQSSGPDGVFVFLQAKDTEIRGTKFVVAGLKEGGLYQFRVRAVNAAGVGDPGLVLELIEVKDRTSKTKIICTSHVDGVVDMLTLTSYLYPQLLLRWTWTPQ